MSTTYCKIKGCKNNTTDMNICGNDGVDGHECDSKCEYVCDEHDEQRFVITCPLCEAEAPYELLNNHTHAWSCVDCPFMAIEFYDHRNIDDLEQAVQQDKV